MLTAIAIKLLWVALGAVLLGIVVYLLIRAITIWFPNAIDGPIANTIWIVYAILVVLAILYALEGGSAGAVRPF